jgi:isopenicillin N synthase-like dioxygenase
MAAEPAMRVPIVDLGGFLADDAAASARAAGEIDRANREIGFFAVSGHGIPAALIAESFAASARFFARPAAEKSAYAPEPGARHHGYHGMAGSGLAAKEGVVRPPDLREYFMAGRPDIADPYFHTESARRFHRANRLPGELAGPLMRLYAATERLGGDLMRLFARALDLPEDWFARAIDRHFSILSTIHYPAQEAPPLAGQIRAGTHTDYGALTLLAQAPGGDGLEVRLRSGAWVEVPCRPDLLVVNIGDMMQRWTNERWTSNFHRVANPRPGAPPRARQSIAYFLHPNHDATIACAPSCEGPGNPPPHAPILAGDYMLEKEEAIAGV